MLGYVEQGLDELMVEKGVMIGAEELVECLGVNLPSEDEADGWGSAMDEETPWWRGVVAGRHMLFGYWSMVLL